MKLIKSTIILIGFLGTIFTTSNTIASSSPLIQGMNQQDEYEGLLTFGLLEATVLEKPDIQQVMEQVIPSTVKIKAGSYSGSGTIVNMELDRIIIASSSHLLMYDDQVEVFFYEETMVSGKILGISQEYDIGFIEIMITEIPYPLMIDIRYTPLDHDEWKNITYGSDVCLVGSADGVASNQESGTVLEPWIFFPEFNSFMMKSYCNGKAGMSGCGTFDSYGNYIGLLTGGLGVETASLPLPIVLEQYNIIVGK